MSYTNIEIKARTTRRRQIRQYLLDNGADFKGLDHQTDTYFNVLNGRLKLRQGNIENSLIFYHRDNQPGPKQSDFELLPVNNGERLKSILANSIGVRITVSKQREIYYIGNVKFHLDVLDNLGEFVEIEATNIGTNLGIDELRTQCNFYIREFEISEVDLVPVSYSDLLEGVG
jgi:predicted adenylyl cyclase CyaB